MTPRVAVVHPQLVAGGGSEACAMWTLQALQDESRLTLVTLGRPDLESMNRKYGTTIDESKIEGRFLRLPPGTRKRFDALRGFRLARYCRRHARDFDVMISAYNVMDFGVAGIQMIADFSFDDALRRELHSANGAAGGGFYKASLGRSLYLGLARALAGSRGDGWKRNLTVANSEWTRDLLRERFGVASDVVYPPVAGGFPAVPWNEREDGFVFIGRLVPEKGVRRVIEILGDVRKEKPVHLHIIGRRERTAYAREVEELCRRKRDWIHLEGEKYGPEKAEFLARHKYGISGCRNEAFGIAVAEMVKAGSLVWVPDGGGQKEIVAHPGLIYSGRGHAAALILAALGAPAAEAALRYHLEARADLFSSGRFVEEMRGIVRGFLSEKHVRFA
ncbi:MAG: glycosyltransferase family 4 protein [Acidobacteria bacterium]|nr:glycosyltransferase family 4 protein [Acidobacteriota bacterium]